MSFSSGSDSDIVAVDGTDGAYEEVKPSESEKQINPKVKKELNF